MDSKNKMKIELATGISFHDNEKTVTFKTLEQEKREREEFEDARKSNKIIEEIIKWVIIAIFVVVLLILGFTH